MRALLTGLRARLSHDEPLVGCPYCSGIPGDDYGCNLCHGKGCVPKSVRDATDALVRRAIERRP